MKNTNSIAIVFNGLYVGGAEKFGISSLVCEKLIDKIIHYIYNCNAKFII